MLLLSIFIFFCLGLGLRDSFLGVGIVTLLLLIILIKKKKKLSLFPIGIFLLGFGLSFINISYQNKTVYNGMVYEVKDNYFLFNSGGERLYVYEKEHHHEIGDFLNIKGYKEELNFTVLESNFDFNKYLKDKGVLKELKVKALKETFKTPIRLESFRNYFLNKFDENTRISIGSILFSDRDDNQLTDDISSLHLNRLISAGGLYFNALISVITYLLSFKLNKNKSLFTAFLISTFYLIISFPRFSLLRLSIIFLFKLINKKFLKDRFSYLDILSITGIFFLVINHHLINQDGFILGFSIPIYLYFINNSFKHLKGIKKKMVTIMLLYLFFIPFEIKYFNGISPLLVIYQFILTPLFILLFFLSLLCLYFIPLYKVVNWYSGLLENIVHPFSKMNLEIYSPSFHPVLTVIYYLLLGLFLYYASICLKPFKRFFLITYLSFLLIYLLPINNYFTDEVSFINVGQGDCCYIRHKNNVIFIDTGGLKYMDLAKESLIPFLKKKRVYDIDYLITTHNDYDHNGAASMLIKNFKVKKYLDNQTFKSGNYGGINLINYNNHISSGNDDNDNSLVIGFSLLKKNFLITGDAGIEIENNMMMEYSHIPCDILKVGHHGSKYSTSDTFIKYLRPKVGIISVGKNNYYGHPTKEVLEILKRNGVQIRRTDLEGTITYQGVSI